MNGFYYYLVCSRDNGAGLVFKKDIGENTKFFLRGIVSANGRCGGKGSYTTFTNTALYSDFISKHEKELRPTAISIGKSSTLRCQLKINERC